MSNWKRFKLLTVLATAAAYTLVIQPALLAAEDVMTGEEKLKSAFGQLKADTAATGETPYEILAGLFKKGSAAEAKDVTGWYYTLSARSPEKSFFGISGGILTEPAKSDSQKVRQLHYVYPSDFDLDTPVSAKMLQQFETAIKETTVVVKFPPGIWKAGKHKDTYRKIKNYVIVKHAGPVIKDAQPPFNSPVYYTCYFKKVAATGNADR